jgi:hypothetical protein
MVIGQFGEDGCDNTAWGTPVCVEVDDYVFGGFQDLFDIYWCVDFGDFAGCFGDRTLVRKYGLVMLVWPSNHVYGIGGKKTWESDMLQRNL